MKDSAPIIGHAADGAAIAIDLDVLIRTRLLLQANSGGGKSFALRRLLEQMFGKVQAIIIDPEGEFASLRERYGFVLVGKGGETPADIRSAGVVAEKLLELNASAVCDLYEMKPFDRPRWVQEFLTALLNAPKELWHPLIVVVDEAHKFCPERGKGEAESTEAMLSLATTGRKRGYCSIFATQRLGKLNKDAAAELLNVLVGRTFLDVDRDRAAEILGVHKAGKSEFDQTIRLLQPGQFYALGPAISTTPVLIKVAGVQTTHPEVGMRMKTAVQTPTPEEVKSLLPKLADLPKAAEERARTVAELEATIRSLRAQLNSKPKPVLDQQSIDAAVARAVATRDQTWKGKLREANNAVRKVQSTLHQIACIAGQGSKDQTEIVPPKFDSHPPAQHATQNIARVPKPSPVRPESSDLKNAPDGLTLAHLRVISRLAELHDGIGQAQVSKEQLAAWSEYSPNGGGYGNVLGRLRSLGLIDYPLPGYVAITDEGRKCASPEPFPLSNDAMLERIQQILSPAEAKIFQAIWTRFPQSITKADLASETDYAADGGGFGNYLGHMRTLGFITYPRKGEVRCADWVFVEEARRA